MLTPEEQAIISLIWTLALDSSDVPPELIEESDTADLEWFKNDLRG